MYTIHANPLLQINLKKRPPKRQIIGFVIVSTADSGGAAINYLSPASPLVCGFDLESGEDLTGTLGSMFQSRDVVGSEY